MTNNKALVVVERFAQGYILMNSSERPRPEFAPRGIVLAEFDRSSVCPACGTHGIWVARDPETFEELTSWCEFCSENEAIEDEIESVSCGEFIRDVGDARVPSNKIELGIAEKLFPERYSTK